jgi:hypothetical protein
MFSAWKQGATDPPMFADEDDDDWDAGGDRPPTWEECVQHTSSSSHAESDTSDGPGSSSSDDLLFPLDPAAPAPAAIDPTLLLHGMRPCTTLSSVYPEPILAA